MIPAMLAVIDNWTQFLIQVGLGGAAACATVVALIVGAKRALAQSSRMPLRVVPVATSGFVALWATLLFGSVGSYGAEDALLLVAGYIFIAAVPFWTLANVQRGWIRAAVVPSVLALGVGYGLLIIAS